MSGQSVCSSSKISRCVHDFTTSHPADRDYTTHIKIGNQRKFLYSDQSEDLLNRIAGLGDRELVFADPTDPYLGVGLDASEAEALGRKSWGRNAFGKSYGALRKKIRNPVSPVKREWNWYDSVW